MTHVVWVGRLHLAVHILQHCSDELNHGNDEAAQSNGAQDGICKTSNTEGKHEQACCATVTAYCFGILRTHVDRANIG